MPFPVNSRYYQTPTATLEIDERRTIVYLRRRFVPQPERFVLLQEHAVVQGDRIDNLAAKYLGDPEQFWRICDANRAMHPASLTAEDRIGARLRITMPEGIPEAPHA